MSTRRARIKAVTSLPPRRKNIAAVNNNKQPPLIDDADKVTRSPKTPKSNITLNSDLTKSPHVKSDFTLNNRTPAKIIKTPNNSGKNRTSVETLSELTQKEKSLNNVEETSKSCVAPKTATVFASPFRKDSPRRAFASPAIPSPKFNKNVETQKLLSQKCTLSPIAQRINENNELQIAENIVSNISYTTSPQKSTTISSQSIISDVVNNEAMDGIIPLKPGAIPKPIDVLKNEIISENAVVLFDPIVPLPSPSKVRPKLRPVPRLGISRRNSLQGSASESEDESRRFLQGLLPSRQRHDSQTSVSTVQSLSNRDIGRVRNDSVCSSVSQIAVPLAQTDSPIKEKPTKASRRKGRRSNAKKWKKQNVKRDNLTMYDLIFYNPTTNPIVPNEDEINIKKANEKEAIEKVRKEKEPPKPKPPKNTAAPVPQIKLGPAGEIILDEQSLVINQTESSRSVSSLVYEGGNGGGGGGGGGGGYRHRRGVRTAEWSAAETVRFYRALAAIGTDFTLMAPLFPDRTRRELKFKFKKEEKLNGAQVDRALRATIQWNVTNLQKEFKEERAAAVLRAEREKKQLQEEKKAERERLKSLKRLGLRKSRGGIALESTNMPGVSHKDMPITADDIILRASLKHRKRKLRETQTEPVSPKLPTMTVLNKSKEDTATRAVTPNTQLKTPELLHPGQIPSNIEKGSLVVLTVDDPASPTKKMLQTYVAHGPGQLAPVALCSSFLNSVVGYMKKNTPKGSSASPQIISPSTIFSNDSRTSTPSGVSGIQSPVKRQRHSSYTITQL